MTCNLSIDQICFDVLLQQLNDFHYYIELAVPKTAQNRTHTRPTEQKREHNVLLLAPKNQAVSGWLGVDLRFLSCFETAVYSEKQLLASEAGAAVS